MASICKQLAGDRLILDPGESRSYQLSFYRPGDSNYSANVFIAISGLSDVSSAKWGFTWDKGRILTIPPNAVDPTSGLTPDKTKSAASNDAPSAATTGQTVDIQAVLPAEGDIPAGLAMIETGALTAEDITATFSDPAAASTFFNDWGWQENSFRYFAPSAGGTTDTGLVYIDIGIHRFLSATGAAQALDYFCGVRQQQMGLGEVASASIGDQTRSIIGQTNMGTEASVYARGNTVVVRVSVMSVGVDPLAEATAITQNIIGKLG